MIKLFDRTVMINLDERTDRLLHGSAMLSACGIGFERVPGIKKENGQEGIYDTLMIIFMDAVYRELQSVMVFEDDVKILQDDFNELLNASVSELPKGWHMLYLGANLPDHKLVTRYSDYLLKTKRALALHAVAYSLECMKMILSLPRQLPVDLQIANFIHPMNETYVTYPLLCSQRPDYSNIENREVCYTNYIEDRYAAVIKHLNFKHEQKSSQGA